jgi:hypothetical protein
VSVGSYLSYAFEAMMVNEFFGQYFLFDPKSYKSVKVPVPGTAVSIALFYIFCVFFVFEGYKC